MQMMWEANKEVKLASLLKEKVDSSHAKQEVSYDKQYSVSNEEMEREILLKPNPKRFVLFPIQYHDIWQFYKKSVACFWTVEEVDLSKDHAHWDNLKPDEKTFITRMLAVLCTNYTGVMKNFLQRICEEVQIPEGRCVYGKQIAMKSIHAEIYSLLMITYVKDQKERDAIFTAATQLNTVGRRTEWVTRWIRSPGTTFAERLILLAIIEGVLCTGISAAFFWIKKREILPGLSLANELTSRDERLHCDFGCLMFKYIAKKPDTQRINTMIKEAVEIEQDLLANELPVNAIGLDCKKACQYVQFLADRLLQELGYDKIWNSENPFDFMANICMVPKMKFFEKLVGEAPRLGVKSRARVSEKLQFTTAADF